MNAEEVACGVVCVTTPGVVLSGAVCALIVAVVLSGAVCVIAPAFIFTFAETIAAGSMGEGMFGFVNELACDVRDVTDGVETGGANKPSWLCCATAGGAAEYD